MGHGPKKKYSITNQQLIKGNLFNKKEQALYSDARKKLLAKKLHLPLPHQVEPGNQKHFNFIQGVLQRLNCKLEKFFSDEERWCKEQAEEGLRKCLSGQAEW